MSIYLLRATFPAVNPNHTIHELDLDIKPLATGISITLVDPQRTEDANPIAHAYIYAQGSKVVLEVQPWDELNEPTNGSQSIVIYDLADVLAVPAELQAAA